MRLNMDCIRDILLCVEEHTSLREVCIFFDVSTADEADFMLCQSTQIFDYQTRLLSHYPNDTLFYHVLYCIKAGLLESLPGTPVYETIITDLTVSGHELINDIRPRTAWEIVSGALRHTGMSGLNAVIEIARSYAISKGLSYLKEL